MKTPIYVYCILFAAATLQAGGSCTTLVQAYPTYLSGCSGNTLIWKDGTRMLYDDGRSKSFQELLNRPDLQDMFRYPYPRGAKGYNVPLPKNFDPGRIRYEPFFRKMYGNSATQVRRHLTTIDWFGKRIRVTKINSVDCHLLAVERDLKRDPRLRKYLIPIGGTFMWRTIAGTHRLSVHSFGAAIDINTKYSAYWRWGGLSKPPKNKIPLAIVEAFERHGFIWGGKWYHYDTMHFEYRPEILLAGNSRIPVSRQKPLGTHGMSKRSAASAKSYPKAPKGRSYIIQSGDTLYSLSRRFGVSKQKIMQVNGIEDPSKIRVGQKLVIPR